MQNKYFDVFLLTKIFTSERLKINIFFIIVEYRQQRIGVQCGSLHAFTDLTIGMGIKSTLKKNVKSSKKAMQN